MAKKKLSKPKPAKKKSTALTKKKGSAKSLRKAVKKSSRKIRPTSADWTFTFPELDSNGAPTELFTAAQATSTITIKVKGTVSNVGGIGSYAKAKLYLENATPNIADAVEMTEVTPNVWEKELVLTNNGTFTHFVSEIVKCKAAVWFGEIEMGGTSGPSTLVTRAFYVTEINNGP